MSEYEEGVLKPIPIVGLNPYKIVEMWKNYRPNDPIEYCTDVLYEEPSPEVWSKVKVEKTDRSKFRANLKAKKYVGKERVESTAFNGDEGKDNKEQLESMAFDSNGARTARRVWFEWVVFFSRRGFFPHFVLF